MTSLKFTQLYDYVIGTLYLLKFEKQTGFHSLRKILNTVLDYPATLEDISLIGKYLEAKGYAKCFYTLGDVQIEVTPSGIIRWENDLQNTTDAFYTIVTKEKVSGLSKRSSSESETQDARKEIFEKLNVVLSFTRNVKDQNPDLDIDAKILNLEFHKIKPDREVILNKLFSIDQLPSIRKEVIYLREVVSL